MTLNSDPSVHAVFSNYPDFVRGKLQALRKLIIETAEETEQIEILEETLKWGEPSFKTKTGSTIRMDWKAKLPKQYALYFQCNSRLVETFRLVYGDLFSYEGNRAIVFKIDTELNIIELKKCIQAALVYHKVKHLLTLGI